MKLAVVAVALLGASWLSRLTDAAAVALVVASIALLVALRSLWVAGDAAKTVYGAIDPDTGRIKAADEPDVEG